MRLRPPKTVYAPRPALEGLLIAVLIFGATAICTGSLYFQARQAHNAALQEELVRLARQAAALIDGDRHALLQSREQMQTPLYHDLLDPLVEFHRIIPEIFYVYTVVERSTGCHLILETTNKSDVLGFRRPVQAAALMDHYAQPDALLLRALREGTPQATSQLYSDEFGTFVSGFAPIRDRHGRTVAIAGVDLDASTYAARLAPMHRALWRALTIAAGLAVITGLGMARFRRVELQRERQFLGAEARQAEVERNNQKLNHQLRFLEAAAQVHHLLLAEREFDRALRQAFELVGITTGADRIRYYRILPDASHHRRVRLQTEWSSAGTSAGPALATAIEASFASNDDRSRTLRGGRESYLAETAEDDQAFLQALGLRSLLLLPTAFDGTCAGVLALEHSSNVPPYAPEERAVLRSLASSIGVAVTRSAAEIEHERDRRLLGGVLDSSTDAVVALNALRDTRGTLVDFEIALMNPVAERLAGRPAEGLIGSSVLTLHPPWREHSLFQQLAAVVQRGDNLDVEHYFSEEAFWPWCRIVAVRLGDGLAVTISNITTRKAAEVELIRAKEGAETADRAKTEFLAVVSHEIRTPMNGVIGFTTLLQDTPLNTDQQEYVHTIRRSSETLLALINEILDFSKIEAGGVELEHLPFRVQEALEDAVQINRQLASAKEVELHFELAPDLPDVVIGDSVRLQQILINLIGNAVKFTSQGSIQVTVTRTPPRAAADRADWHELQFVVRDSGIGIPPDKIGRLFKPFSQADSSTTRRFGGTGLGLAICKRLCQLMGGDIRVESQPGVGSTFTFSIQVRAAGDLPVSLPAPEAVAGQLPSASAPAPFLPLTPARPASGIHPLSVLVAEDNPVNQRVVELLLRRLGLRASFAVNGREAVRKWLNESPDLILMDIQMPEMDGYAATAEIRNLESFLPDRAKVHICALTAEAMRADRQRCFECGMNDYLSKPIMPQKLAELIQRTAEKKRSETAALVSSTPNIA